MPYYVIRVQGELGEDLTEWFGGLSLCPGAEASTLSGWLPDQSALFGVLHKIRDLNLLLLALEYQPTRSSSCANPPQNDNVSAAD